jgi:regulator of replication initiation timing
MTAEESIKQTIGALVIENANLREQNEILTQKLAEETSKEDER